MNGVIPSITIVVAIVITIVVAIGLHMNNVVVVIAHDVVCVNGVA